MKLKLKDIFSSTKNPKNHQISFHLRVKELRRRGITPEQLNEMLLLKPKKIIRKNVK